MANLMNTSSEFLPDVLLVDVDKIEQFDNYAISSTSAPSFTSDDSDELEPLGFLTKLESVVEGCQEIAAKDELILATAVIQTYSDMGFGPLTDELFNYLDGN